MKLQELIYRRILRLALVIINFSSLLPLHFVWADMITHYDETKIQEPFTDSNEEFLQSLLCRTRIPGGWDYCSSTNDKKEEQMNKFTFTNWGPNHIIPHTGFGIGRDFEFLFEGFARSDLGMLVWDMPDDKVSHGHLKLMMFFPRFVMPAIRFVSKSQANNPYETDLFIVTLPTREEMIFNSQTKEVLGGVITEAPMKQDEEGFAINPALTYKGSGVVVEADRINDYPVGQPIASNVLRDMNEFSTNDNLATIRKKGHKDCKIPVKNLWYTDEKKGGNIFFNKKYITDYAFDKFLKEQCKFSMY